MNVWLKLNTIDMFEMQYVQVHCNESHLQQIIRLSLGMSECN